MHACHNDKANCLQSSLHLLNVQDNMTDHMTF